MLPYAIMVSEDRTHFAFLDFHCSFGVFKGDVDPLLHEFLLHPERTPDLTSMPIEVKFRTQGFPSHGENCFAALDEVGIFSIFSGLPHTRHRAIWSSQQLSDVDYFARFKRFYLELSNFGEFAVRMVSTQTGEPECVWSTTSCNAIKAVLRDIMGNVANMARELVDTIRPLITRSKTLQRNMKILFQQWLAAAVAKVESIRFIRCLRGKVDYWYRVVKAKIRNEPLDFVEPNYGHWYW